MVRADLTRFEAKLGAWQRRSGTPRVVVTVTLLSMAISTSICCLFFVATLGDVRTVWEEIPTVFLALPALVPLLVAPVATAQLARSLGAASLLVEELSKTREELIEEVAARQAVEDELRQLAHRDPLTGVLNRRGLFDAFDSLEPEVVQKMSVAIVDIDDFKQVNDTHGHAAGDRLLRIVADQLVERAGAGAIVARLGGDEFAVVLGLDADARSDRSGWPYSTTNAGIDITDPELPSEITCSVGVARHCAGDRVDVTLAAADRRLYEHKSLHPNAGLHTA